MDNPPTPLAVVPVSRAERVLYAAAALVIVGAGVFALLSVFAAAFLVQS